MGRRNCKQKRFWAEQRVIKSRFFRQGDPEIDGQAPPAGRGGGICKIVFDQR